MRFRPAFGCNASLSQPATRCGSSAPFGIPPGSTEATERLVESGSTIVVAAGLHAASKVGRCRHDLLGIWTFDSVDYCTGRWSGGGLGTRTSGQCNATGGAGLFGCRCCDLRSSSPLSAPPHWLSALLRGRDTMVPGQCVSGGSDLHTPTSWQPSTPQPLEHDDPFRNGRGALMCLPRRLRRAPQPERRERAAARIRAVCISLRIVVCGPTLSI